MQNFLVRVKRVSGYDEKIIENVYRYYTKDGLVVFLDKDEKELYAVSVYSLMDFKPTTWSNPRSPV